MDTNLILTEFDNLTCGSYFQMIKAYVPYIDKEHQKIIAIFIRLMELIQTMDFYKTAKCLPDKSAREPADIMKDIKRYCPKKDCEILETISNLGNISEAMKVYENINKNSTDGVFAFLSPKQQELYNRYKKMLDV